MRDLLAPFDAPQPTVFDSPLQNFRLRAQSGLWREAGERHYAMFSQEDKRTPIRNVRISIAFLPAHQPVDAAAQGRLASQFSPEPQVVSGGVPDHPGWRRHDHPSYHRPLDEHWHAAASKLAAELNVSVIGRSKGKREVIGHDYVAAEKLEVGGRTFSYRQPEGASPSPSPGNEDAQLGVRRTGRSPGRLAGTVLRQRQLQNFRRWPPCAQRAGHRNQQDPVNAALSNLSEKRGG